ncbi:MAG TPA: glycosyl hydrolase family 28 protein [Bryobacteraceae bacterium]|jgi:polygalacturonase
MNIPLNALLGIVLASIPVAIAQDTRSVSEPHIPPPCAVAQAMLTGPIAAADESKLDTDRLQHAIDGCTPGKSVVLQSDGTHNAFLSGPLRLRTAVTLVVAQGVTLYASRDPRLYDIRPGSCGIVTESGRGCKPLIGGDRISYAAVMGEGTIDGRGAEHLLGQRVSWWDLAQQAKVSNKNQNCPRLIVITHSQDFSLYKIKLQNSPNFHVVFSGNGFTAWGVIIDTAKTARNTDGIDPSSATNVTITQCFIHTGDDNVAIKAGSAGGSSHMTIAHNHFYSGHGMSIGSETDGGASAIRVSDLSIDGADNGLRIKSNVSRGGLVKGIVYEDVCIRNTKNPIYMDSNYSFFGAARNKPPLFRDIEFHNVRIEGAGKITLDGLDESHRLDMVFDNVIVDDPREIKLAAHHANVRIGPGSFNLPLTGDDVTVSDMSGKASPQPNCAEKFIPMPSR